MGSRDLELGGIGVSVKRKEDARFLTGAGQYTDDVVLPGQTYAVFLRSPHAHAVIKSINTAAAKAAPGVLAVFTGADVANDKINGVPCGWLITDVHGQPMKEPPHPVLAQGKVRYVGDQVAMVVAASQTEARDAAELIEVDYDVLDPVVALDRAHEGPALHDAAPDNKCYTWALGDKTQTDAAFAKAAHITKLDITNNRLAPNAIEPRAANAHYERASDSYTLYVANQNPHVERLLMTAFVMGLPEHKVRVIAPDVGGGFGSKIYLYAEDVAVTWAARKVNRPVKWTCDRSEAFLSDAHGRDHITHAELALDRDGHFLGFRVHTRANMGAYLSTFSTAIPTILYATLLAGQYTTPAIHVTVDAYFTTTAPVDAYRGAGRPEATYLLERIVSRAAWELGLTQDEIRRRNFITKFPYATPVALTYDIGDYHACMKRALELGEVAGFAERRKQSEARGLKRGIGFSSYIEACGLAPSNIAGALGARAGVFEAGGTVFESEIWADLPVVQSVFKRLNYFQTVRVRLTNAAALAELQAYNESDPRLKLDLKSESDYFAGQATRTLDLIQKLGWPLAIAMAFGALAGALNTMYSSVAARATEIATLRAIGFGGVAAFVGTLIESLVLAAAGGLLGALAAFTYVLLAGYEVPAQRTLYMLTVMAAALWMNRMGSALAVLSTALLVVVLIDPWAVLAAGFWLSFGAVGVILYVSVGRVDRAHWLTTWARVQWAVTLALMPALLAMFQQVSIISPVANALAIPLVSFLVVPLTLVGMLLPVDWLLQMAHAVMAACLWALEWMSALPAAVWQQHAPPGWAVALAVAGGGREIHDHHGVIPVLPASRARRKLRAYRAASTATNSGISPLFARCQCGGPVRDRVYEYSAITQTRADFCAGAMG